MTHADRERLPLYVLVFMLVFYLGFVVLEIKDPLYLLPLAPFVGLILLVARRLRP